MANPRQKNSLRAARQRQGYGENYARGVSHQSSRNVSSGWTADLPSRRSFAGRGGAGFTLQQEAMNTDRRHRAWASDSRFRHSPVQFQSAGEYNANDMTRTRDQDDAKADESQADAASAVPPLASGDLDPTQLAMSDMGPSSGQSPEVMPTSSGLPGMSTSNDQALYMIDDKGSMSHMGIEFAPPTDRSSSPTPSGSSEEIILFTGRNSEKAEDYQEHSQVSASQASVIQASGAAQGDQDGQKPSNGTSKVLGNMKAVLDANAGLNEHSVDDRDTPQGPKRSRKSRRPRKKRKPGLRKSDDEVLDDYIANLQEHGEAEVFNKLTLTGRDLGGSNLAVVVEKRALVSSASKTSSQVAEHGWGPAELQDFDDLATSEEVLDQIRVVLAKRTRKGQVQYLVVWEGYTTDDAKWIHESSLTMEGAAEKISQFEERYQQELDEDEEDDDDGSEEEDLSTADNNFDEDWKMSGSEGAEGGSDDEEERLNDNADLLQRRVDRMTDEQIARILAKQEELGLGSDEILLFNGDDEDENALQGHGIGHRSRSGKLSNRDGLFSKRQKQRLLSDVIHEDDELDPTEWQGARAPRKGKGRRRALAFELSDSELEANLQAAWESDRTKKKIRKQEREELRAQGLLGNGKKAKAKARQQQQQQNAAPNDPINLVQIKSQIRSFVISSEDSLALPPMDIFNRKIVHEIANAFNLKSKSAGSHSERFTTLYKTRRSSMLDESALDMIESELGNRRLLRQLQRRSTEVNDRAGGVRRKKTREGARKSGTGIAAASYRDGDIVGAAAPEIGSDNRGRAMLERMGWSSGTALGALDNKGILHPVEHIVKTSKTGLG